MSAWNTEGGKDLTMQPRSGYVNSGDAQLYFETVGQGHPIIFIVAQSLDTRMWDEQFAHFARSHRVIRYDLRGQGQSKSPLNHPFSHYDDLLAVMDHLEIEQAHLVGLSLGGGVAINFSIVHPQRVSALVAADTYLNGYPWPSMTPRILEVVMAARGGEWARARTLWMDLPWFLPARDKPQVTARLAEIVDGYDLRVMAQTVAHDWSKPLAIDHLSQIKLPTLVIVGQRDTDDNHAVADLLTAKIPNARKVEIPAVGHMSNMEDPQAFNQAIREFFEEAEEKAGVVHSV